MIPDPLQTVNTLGRKICEAIVRSDKRLETVVVPEFDGALAPLDDFLREALERIPELRVVMILDEFDELPFGLYERGGIGNSFFLTLRSISGKEPFGFLLVGGEGMSEILGRQG